MATKLYNAISEEHGGAAVGKKVKMKSDHYEAGNRIKKNSQLILTGIVHFPTRYLLEDEEGKKWTAPIHSVEFD